MELGSNDNTGGWAKALAETLGIQGKPATAAAPKPAAPEPQPGRKIHPAPQGILIAPRG